MSNSSRWAAALSTPLSSTTAERANTSSTEDWLISSIQRLTAGNKQTCKLKKGHFLLFIVCAHCCAMGELCVFTDHVLKASNRRNDDIKGSRVHRVSKRGLHTATCAKMHYCWQSWPCLPGRDKAWWWAFYASALTPWVGAVLSVANQLGGGADSDRPPKQSAEKIGLQHRRRKSDRTTLLHCIYI